MLDTHCRYRILMSGTLDADWSDRLSGMTISAAQLADGAPVTMLIGDLADQSALVGVLNTLHDFGIPLLAMDRVGAEAEKQSEPLPPERKD